MTTYFKYPSTSHHRTSPGVSDDDCVIKSMTAFEGQEVVITKKMDGENTTMYTDHVHARSIDSRNHESRDWVKRFHASIKHEIPAGYRICGENLYAQHSIIYDDLLSYFYGFSVWTNEPNVSLPWDDVLVFFELLGITPVPVVYRGLYSEAAFASCVTKLDLNRDEGLVMRVTKAIPFEDFGTHMCKWVRKGHVQTNKHWMHQEVIPNIIRKIY